MPVPLPSLTHLNVSTGSIPFTQLVDLVLSFLSCCPRLTSVTIESRPIDVDTYDSVSALLATLQWRHSPALTATVTPALARKVRVCA